MTINRPCWCAAAALGLVGLAGCPAMTPPDGNTPVAGDSFATAPLLALDSDGRATLGGSVSKTGIDVYDLGALQPGDRVIVSVDAAAGSNLDPNTAIFDADGELFTVNDDVNSDAGIFKSHIDAVIRYASDHYYIAISESFFGNSAGAYSGSVQVIFGGAPVSPAAQIVYLNFNGGPVNIPGVFTGNLPAFNAADIDATYAGKTSQIKATIVDTVKSNYAGFDLIVMSSDNGPPPTEPHSTVHFGAFDKDAFGLSQDVDHLNENPSDQSIIFTDQFDDPFASRPSVQGIGVAIGNVAAHEIGHLLGLDHVDDITNLMDTTGSASTLLADQKFKSSPLDDTIFPVGSEDGIRLLRAILGMTGP